MQPTPHQTAAQPAAAGVPRIGINQLDMGGWVRVYLGQGDPGIDVAPYLSHALNGWFRERPHLRLRFVLPVTRQGNTVELHAWYEQVWFSDQSPLARAIPRTPGSGPGPAPGSATGASASSSSGR
jgi:hypothetical protein